MKNRRLIPGVVFILIGAILLLSNYNYINVHVWNLVHLWPIIIVIVGVNLIFANNRSGWATAIKLAVIIVGFGLLLFGNFSDRYPFWDRHSYHFDMGDDDDYGNYSEGRRITKLEGTSVFTETDTVNVKFAKLNISGGATSYRLSDTTNLLFSASTQEYIGNYTLNSDRQDSLYVLNFGMRSDNRSMNWKEQKKSNTATFKLNANPIWDVEIKTGATDLHFDLSKFKVRSLELAGGAADFEIKLGQPLAVTNVDVATGASEVTISIPKDAACRITKGTALSSNSFEGFTKGSDNAYETPGFANATNKIYIKIKGGMSSFKVKRY